MAGCRHDDVTRLTMGEYTIKALTNETWEAFATL